VYTVPVEAVIITILKYPHHSTVDAAL